MSKNGTFIVIDGSDGSGKATQTNKLIERLKNEGYKVEMIDFPQYGQKSAGLVEEYLNGKYGGPDDVGPFIASLFFACDRYDGSFKIKKWLDEGKVVISNRYTSSNMGHQAGKISDLEQRDKYLDWISDIEFNILGLPRPDLTILLYLDPEIQQNWVDKKGKRKYIEKGKRDIHENDLHHLREATKAYKYVAEKFNWPIINAHQTIDKVHNDVWEKVKSVL